MQDSDMAATDLPLSLILSRSVSEGYLKRDNPELLQLRSNGSLRNDLDGRQRMPLSQSTTIYNHRIGLTSTTRSRSSSSKPKRTGTFNLISSRRRTSQAIMVDGDGEYPRPSSPRGYGLLDSSSDESDFDNSGSDLSDDGEQDSRLNGRGGLTQQHVPAASTPAHYVAHITGRMDPWEAQMQKIQDLGKDMAPLIADQIDKDFETIARRPSSAAVGWDRDGEDISQRLKKLAMETEAIKDKRKKEIESRNQSLNKDIETCMARIKDEREMALRIQQEAARKIQEEKDRVAKEAEDKKKAEIAMKEEQEKKKAGEAAAAAAAEAEKAKKAAAAASAAAAESSSIFASEPAQAEWDKYSKVLEQIKSVVMPSIKSNPVLTRSCNTARRDIVSAIGRVTNKQDEIFRVATEIDDILKSTMSQGEIPYYWAMNVTAKKLVKQAETEALVKSAPAFPLAHIAVLLFTNHPKFLEVLMARFAKKCLYVTPIYLPKAPTESADEYMIKIGYKKKDAGFESETQYNSRQCAIFTLYCAIIQTTPPVGTNIHGMSHGWAWMSRILNMPPRPITPALIQVFLEVCGNTFMRTYRNQATKVLRLMMENFIPIIPQQGIAGTTRLKTVLEDFIKTGQIPVAEGRDYGR
ncbi:hypothetical protein BGX33_003041 [Mortierella sp. NVP41]|nr:hypothetical protein BGX33_003041 [Mortierella sp. NVP41]